MKLIRWVEVHIGRSRRKSKKDKDAIEGKLTINCGADIPRRRDESTPSTPLHKIEPIGKDLPAPRSAGSTPHRTKHPPSPHPLLRAPDTPSIGGRSSRRSLQIRTSFLDPGLIPLSSGGPQPIGFGSSTALDTGSPRVRSRIRTNPWLPSPRSSASSAVDCGWTGGSGGIRSSSIGSESSESIAGSGFGSQSSGGLWEGYSGDPWNSYRGNGLSSRSPSVHRLPRVTLERSLHRGRPLVEPDRLSFGGDDEDKPYCPVTYCRPIPRSAWMDFRELSSTDLVETRLANANDDGESSDEAYSEDYVHSEEQDELPLDVIRASDARPQDTGSPQADSACGSDRDNSSCSTTPLSETPHGGSSTTTAPPGRKSIADSKELLQDKVQRLRIERHLVDQRMQEARAEEIIRREEQLLLQRELVQFRRLLLLQTLSDLRDQLERQGKRMHRSYGNGDLPDPKDNSGGRLKPDSEEDTWLQVHTELVG